MNSFKLAASVAGLVTLALATAGVKLAADSGGAPERVVEIKAKRFEYAPREITLKKGEPVVLKLTSLDRLHGFDVPELGIRGDILPGESAQIRLVPQQVGTFAFHCDIFCGSGHETMTGSIKVVE
jgi:cytochrome c oxidase subunit 2